MLSCHPERSEGSAHRDKPFASLRVTTRSCIGRFLSTETSETMETSVPTDGGSHEVSIRAPLRSAEGSYTSLHTDPIPTGIIQQAGIFFRRDGDAK